jgi:hypothetical protein
MNDGLFKLSVLRSEQLIPFVRLGIIGDKRVSVLYEIVSRVSDAPLNKLAAVSVAVDKFCHKIFPLIKNKTAMR